MPALLYLQRAIESDPSDSQSWHLLGKCLADHGQVSGAYDCFQQVCYCYPLPRLALSSPQPLLILLT